MVFLAIVYPGKARPAEHLCKFYTEISIYAHQFRFICRMTLPILASF